MKSAVFLKGNFNMDASRKVTCTNCVVNFRMEIISVPIEKREHTFVNLKSTRLHPPPPAFTVFTRRKSCSEIAAKSIYW
jgi:hypothetical protein